MICLKKSSSLCVFLFVVGFLLFSLIGCSAANYSLYASVSSNDSVVNNLIGIYLNSDTYDPFNQYFCGRFGQYDYILFYGKNLTEGGDYIRYTGTYNGNQLQYTYTTGHEDQININYQNYIGVGNVPGSIQNDKHSQFGFGYVIMVLVILISILFLFKTFRKVYRPRSDKGYTL